MIRKIKLGRKQWVLVASIIFGGLGAVGSSYYLDQRVNEIKRLQSATVRVVVARDELSAGSVISVETVSARDVPEEWAQSGAVRPDDFASIDQAVLKHPVGKGEMIMWAMVEKAGEQSMAMSVQKGRRAITVPVDEISSLSGMLQPGDFIDLVVTVESENGSLNFPLLQQVRVLATGTQMRPVKAGEGGGEGVRSYDAITLDTSPEEARRVIAARDSGRLTAMLRNPSDRQVIGNYRLSLEDLAGRRESVSASASLPRTALTEQGVRIVYGDQQ